MINFYTTTTIHLSLEDYTNKGLKREDIMKRLEKIQDVIRVEKAYINHNVNVKTLLSNPENIETIVYDIEDALDEMLICVKAENVK